MFETTMRPQNVEDSSLFTLFHGVRESVFLNTAVDSSLDSAHPLEIVGNAFLAPVRYLFGGRTITRLDLNTRDFQDSYLEEKPTFDYSTDNWVLTACMVLVLPICLLLGAIIKGFSYISQEVRNRGEAIGGYLHSQKVNIDDEAYHRLGIDPLFSDEEVDDLLQLEREGELSEKQEKEIGVLQDLSLELNQSGVIYWLDRASALGAYRYEGYMPYDHNIDIGILDIDHRNVRNILNRLDPEKYMVQDWSPFGKPGSLLRLYIRETNSYITFHHYHADPTTREVKYDFCYAGSHLPEGEKKRQEMYERPWSFDDVFPLRKVSFDGLSLRVPAQLERVLKVRYGDDLSPPYEYDAEKKSYTKKEGHPYFASTE